MSVTDNQSQAAKQLLPSAPVSLRLSVWAPIFLLLSASCISVPGPLVPRRGISLYRVERALSGDTIIVKGIGRVKYIGVVAQLLLTDQLPKPSPGHIRPSGSVSSRRVPVAPPRPSIRGKHDEKFWRESLEKNRELVEGKWVRLEFDVKDKDASGQWLAYVFVPQDPMTEIFVNGEILRLGLARVEQSTVNTRYLGRLERLQQRAKQNRRGIWSE